MATLSELIASAPEHLHPSLSFEVGSAASYVTSRQTVTLTPVGGDRCSPTGSRLVRFSLPTSGFIDPTRVKIKFRLYNDTAFDDYVAIPEAVGNGAVLSRLQLLGPPSILFSRVRSLTNGVLLSDLQRADRASYLFDQLLRDRMLAVEDSLLTGCWCPSDFDRWGSLRIESGTSKRKLMPCDLLSPLFSQVLFLPAKELALQLELELVSDPDSVVCQQLFQLGVPVPGEGPLTDVVNGVILRKSCKRG
jgi:hypothetical protein